MLPNKQVNMTSPKEIINFYLKNPPLYIFWWSREKKTQSHSIFAWRRSGFPYTNNSLDLFTGSHPRDPTYQDASCHCPLTLDDHICSPIYRLSTQWPETVYTDYNVHTACQWEHLPDPSLFCIINTPPKELWYTFKKNLPTCSCELL